jgi:hypothetical protein
VDFHRRQWLKVDRSKPAGVAIGVEPVLGQLAQHDCWHRPATSAAAWSLANVELPAGTVDLDRNIDSIGAVGTDSHIPCEDIDEKAENLRDDWLVLSYLGM